jgi:putative nucleotidyltransferase with HDIG domain
MTDDWFASRLEFFREYVGRFRDCPEVDRANIDLKRDHSIRVLGEAEMILDELDADAELALCARTAALFHDIGRFVQYREFKTFSDSRSKNHGLLGCRELGKVAALDGMTGEQKAMVRAVVAMHNRRFAPRGLDERLDFALRVVRDADKLDILGIMIEHFRPDGGINEVVTLHLENDPQAYTPDLLEQAVSGMLADYAGMVWVNDFKLLVLSWVHDLNFPAARRAFRERGYADRVLATLPDSPEFGRLREVIREALEE